MSRMKIKDLSVIEKLLDEKTTNIGGGMSSTQGYVPVTEPPIDGRNSSHEQAPKQKLFEVNTTVINLTYN